MHRSPRRDRGALLQPRELGFQFALIFVGHGARWLKNAMRLRHVNVVARNIVAAGPLCKQKKRYVWLRLRAAKIRAGGRLDPYSRLVTDDTEI